MRLWLIIILFAPISIAFAVEEQTQNILTLNQAIVNVLERSPLLTAADYESKAAAARIRSAQSSPAFRTSLEFANFSNSNSDIGNDNLESTLKLSKVLELGDKARLRGEVASNKALLLGNNQDTKRLDLLAETTKRFIQIITNQERLVIASDSLALAENTKKIVGRRVKAGRSPNAELRRAKIALARKELEYEHAEHKLSVSRLKLVTLWGETEIYFSTAEANLFKIEPATPFEELITLLEHNPELVRYATEERLASTRIQLAKSRRRADIEVSAGVRHFKSTEETGLILSVNIPWGTSSRAASHIEEAEILSMRDPLVYKQRRLNLHTTLFEVHQKIKHALSEIKALQEIIIPQARKALKDYEKGYAAGRYSFLELTEAQRTLLNSRLDMVMAAENYHRYRIEIDRLTGAGLSTGANP
jgi:cobalt-zinc-cadmium efflux system outer membrane protein